MNCDAMLDDEDDMSVFDELKAHLNPCYKKVFLTFTVEVDRGWLAKLMAKITKDGTLFYHLGAGVDLDDIKLVDFIERKE